MESYEFLRTHLRWPCDADPLFRDGSDHYEIDQHRFERAARAIRPIRGAVIADIGSFPGYGLWAFKECGRYIGVGKCPDWYRAALSSIGQAEWIDWDFESAQSPAAPSVAPDVVLLQEVIEHIRQPRKFLERLHAWMPPGARLYATTNNLSYIVT
jgi:hypothetical protein